MLNQILFSVLKTSVFLQVSDINLLTAEDSLKKKYMFLWEILKLFSQIFKKNTVTMCQNYEI